MEGASTYYYHNDHLGTPQKMTDSSGTVVWAADYKPFGEATITVSTITNNLRYPGQYFDQETGLHYNYYRDYNPVIDRYIEGDPIGLRGGLNLYLYAGANSLRFTDPRGLLLGGNNATIGPPPPSPPPPGPPSPPTSCIGGCHPGLVPGPPPAGLSQCFLDAASSFGKCALASFIIMDVPVSIAIVGCMLTGPGAEFCITTVLVVFEPTELVVLSACAADAYSKYNNCKGCKK